LDQEAAGDFYRERFNERDRNILSIWNRNQFEFRKGKGSEKELNLGDLYKIIKQYTPLQPLEKMDNALLNIDKLTQYIGDVVRIVPSDDYPYYHCFHYRDLFGILRFLDQDGLIKLKDGRNPQEGLWLTSKGYQRLRELKKPGKDSNQCFVAMWFAPEMNDVYLKAIKPAIELNEDEETKSGYEAIRIDTVEHVNDVNDEIIAQIRRSKFMVCDLTGYRGGVYFEAGFAYGLGLSVIYTCRKDWSNPKPFYDEKGNVIQRLFNQDKKLIPIQQEGIHFDLAHRNRIEWYEKDLDDFRNKLRNRINAVIV